MTKGESSLRLADLFIRCVCVCDAVDTVYLQDDHVVPLLSIIIRKKVQHNSVGSK